MFQIKELFAKFRAMQDPQQIRESIAQVINSVCNIKLLNSQSLEIRNNIVWFKINPAIKQKIFYKKADCLAEIQKQFPGESIIDMK